MPKSKTSIKRRTKLKQRLLRSNAIKSHKRGRTGGGKWTRISDLLNTITQKSEKTISKKNEELPATSEFKLGAELKKFIAAKKAEK